MRRSTLSLFLGALAWLMFSQSASAQATQPFVGEIAVVAFNFEPVGWAFCDGSLLPISEYETLFNLIGTTYGGNGQTNFALPDLRGRTAIHQGHGYIIGQNGGEETVTLNINQMPAHIHVVQGTSSLGSSPSPSGNVWAAQSRLDIYSSAEPFVQMAGGALSSAGSGLPHDNQSPYLVMNYIISLFGIYPSQN